MVPTHAASVLTTSTRPAKQDFEAARFLLDLILCTVSADGLDYAGYMVAPYGSLLRRWASLHRARLTAAAPS